MGYRIAADAVVLLHLGFIVFALAGGLLVLRWPVFALAHVPAMAWATMIEVTGRLCPLTTVENRLRLAAGARGYTGGFVEHYVIGIVYPAGLTRQDELVLAAVVVIVNLLVYAWVLARRRRAARGVRHVSDICPTPARRDAGNRRCGFRIRRR